MDIDKKTMFTAVVVLLALAAVYLAVNKQGPAGSELSFLNGQKTNPQAFIANLENAEKVYIVQDLRGAEDKVRTNIQQCGIDFAGSGGLVTKEQFTFAFEGSKCISITNPDGDVQTCMDEIKKAKNKGKVFVMKWV